MKVDKIQYVEFETAKLAKELNFNWWCNYYYEYALTEQFDEEDGTSGSFGWKKFETNFQDGFFINNHEDVDFSNDNWYLCGAPTQCLLQCWLREEHNLWVSVDVSNVGLFARILHEEDNRVKEIFLSEKIFNKHEYEAAFELGLFTALEYLKNTTND